MLASDFLNGIATLQTGGNINCNRVILLNQPIMGLLFLVNFQCSSTVKDEWRLIESLRPIFADQNPTHVGGSRPSINIIHRKLAGSFKRLLSLTP